MTATVPPPAAAAVPPPPYEVDAPTRLVRVCANLLPEDVLTARQVRSVRNRVGLGLIVLVVLLVLAYAYSWFQTNGLKGDVSSAQAQGVTLQSQMARYAPLQAAQAQTQQIESTLQQVMAGDLQWKALIDKFNASATNGVKIDSVSAVVSPPGGVTTQAANPLSAPGSTIVGLVTITGTAPNSSAVGKFVSTLNVVRGLTDPVPASVTGAHGSYQFTLAVSLTSEALGGKYAVSTAPAAPTASPTPGGS